MNPRNLVLGLVLAALAGSAAWFILAGAPAEAAGRGLEPGPDDHPTTAPVAAPDVGPALVAPSAPDPDRAPAPRAKETANWTSGVIQGDLALATEIIPELDAVAVTILEAINRPVGASPAASAPAPERLPYTRSQQVKVEKHTVTTFAFQDVPFSPYGYAVSVFALGRNGSESHAIVNKEHPIANVVLAVTNGVPLTVLVRDQDRAPLAGVLVTLSPKDAPGGRPIQRKDCDSFGVAVFESVLRGPYKIHVGPLHAEMCEAQDFEVLGGPARTVQTTTVIVPRGSDLPIQVFGPGGMGLADVEVDAYMVDTTQFRRFEGKTDYSGQLTLKHLPAGSYQVNLKAEAFDKTTRTCVITEGVETKPLVVKLLPR